MSVRLSKSFIIGMLIATVITSFNLRPSLAQDASTLQKIESDDTQVVQLGSWSSQTADAASSGNYLYSSGSEADVLTLEFSGSALEILYIAGPSLGTLAIEVDGTVLRTVITTDTEIRYGQSAKINYLTDEPHKLKVYAQAGGVLAIDAFVITPVESSTGPVNETVAVSAEAPTAPHNCPFVDNIVQRLSVGNGNVQANADAIKPDVSADGRYVVFQSSATNLGNFDPRADIFMLDRYTCVLTPVASVRNAQEESDLLFLAMTDDANYVVYTYFFGDGMAGPPINRAAIYNRATNLTLIIGQAPALFFGMASLRGNRYLVLNQYAQANVDLALFDLTTNVMTNIDLWPGQDVYTHSYASSPDGRYITFRAEAPNQCFNSTRIQAFLYDRQTQTTECVSAPSNGTASDGYVNGRPLVSDDGRYVAFESSATNLVPGDNNDYPDDVFVRDRQTGELDLISVGVGGVQEIGQGADLLDLSADGRYVLFRTRSPNLVLQDTNGSFDLYLVDRITNEIQLIGAPNNGYSFHGGVQNAHMTPDARLVVFESDSTTIVPNDTNGHTDSYSAPGVDREIVPAVGDALALFHATSNTFSLATTLQDFPPAGAFNIYTSNVLPPATNGRWVMGDWDGDGEDTPGVYASNGVFYYTNEIGASTTWSSVWVGLLDRPPVAGRFNAAVNHDCIGAVDSANFPPHGTAFALYFTCDLTDGTAPALAFQWLSVLLPDAAGFSGTHQFAAGDFNNDGVDSIAVRRGEFIAFGNVPPTTLLSEFNLAQYWGVPPVTGGEAGTFLAGDFDNTAGDSFGVFYQNGHFYYRNLVEWSPVGHLLQRVGQPIGVPVQATSWH